MSRIAFKGNASGTGTFTFESPSTNTDRTLNLPDEAGTVLTSVSDIESQVKTATNASGTAPIYACRAWVNFNGQGTVAIRDSGNVSSITDNGTADYTVNFTTAMTDTNYAVAGGARFDDNSNAGAMRNVSICAVGTLANAMTTSSVRLSIQFVNAGTDDCQVITAVIHR